MSRQRNTLSDLLASYYPPPPEPRNALLDWYTPPSNALSGDYRPKTEYVPGYYRNVPNGLLGYRQEWVAGYWRREG